MKRTFALAFILGLTCCGAVAVQDSQANNVQGAFGPVTSWPLIAVHAVMMPDGRVMSYGTDGNGKQTGYFIYDIWDPVTGIHSTLPNFTNTDIFCGSQIALPDGSGIFLAGGDNWTGTGTTNTGNNNSNFLSLSDDTLQRQSNMTRARWYSSSTTLLNGETYIQGGSGGTDRPEVRGTNGVFRSLTGANTGGFAFMYPRNFIAPDGRVFGFDSAGLMYYINPVGAGTVTSVGQFADNLPRGSDSSVAMFRPGRILQFGGTTNGAIVIDINGATPVITPTASMQLVRKLANATILADGKVLATGGSSVWNQLTNVSYNAEIWNPGTGQWTVGATAVKARLYHSTAVLLPDARVLVAGGGAPGPQNNLNIEMYTPPYLFDTAGGLAPRPVIDDAPTTLEIGQTFSISYSNAAAISRVTLVKTASVTHSFNMDQRFVELTLVNAGGGVLNVQAPTRATDAPPGYYLVFIIDGNRVPSFAKIVRVGVAADPNPPLAPVLTNPGNQAGAAGVPRELQLVASDPNGDFLGYEASGLPFGLSINPLTGLISGTPTTDGSYNVVVTVSDGVNSDTAAFVWVIEQNQDLTVAPLGPQPASAVGSSVTFTAASNGINARYSWDFGDGSLATAYSVSPAISHTFATPGVYYVIVTVNDDRNIPQSQTVVHTVHLPLTPNRPTSSSQMALETSATGNPRLWVVNQDNDSVSVFDTVTRARLAEVAVGTAPRSVAIAPNGLVWVTNRQSNSISVIDPNTRAIVRTVGLPRASQPYGIAFAPTGGLAYVALGATGVLRKLDAATYALRDDLTLGADIRGVAVSADGATVYVSRFITPPVPGEGTATPQTEVADVQYGGQVIAVAAGSMTVQGTVVLRHNDALDTEVSGRGLPNYLGAAAISPDGTQAWVPAKMDNIKRGVGRDLNALDFKNTVRAISSVIDLAQDQEDYSRRVDHDNASVASAAVFDSLGIYLFVALETSREVAIVDAHHGAELGRFDVGRAPQSLALSSDGLALYVSNFMDRTVTMHDLTGLIERGELAAPSAATLGSVGTEKLTAQVLLGKQLFYDARDPRLARDAYMSCASCHNDGGQDGRVWDLTGFGEGLRNTIALRGRASAHGFLHWSNNFDEVQDFEGQIRALAGGTGLMNDDAFNAGTRRQPLGDPKAGQSADLDALAAYLASLSRFDNSPFRTSGGALTSDGAAGKALFESLNCAACHSGTAFTGSGANTFVNVGTIKQPTSGKRLGEQLDGIDVPTLRDVWATTPYLHDGSAATLEEAVRAHTTVAEIGSLTEAQVVSLAGFLRQIGREEVSATSASVGVGTGLAGRYFTNITLSAFPALERTEAVNFNWSSASPGPGIGTNSFSVRWTGYVEAPTTGSYRFQTVSDDGVRLWVNGVQLIDNWTLHGATTNTSGTINLVAAERYAITMEFYENTGKAVARLRWRLPGTTSYPAIPATRLYRD